MTTWSTKNWVRFGVYVIVTTILITLRISGVRNDFLKSFVYFYSGCFYGVALTGYWHGITGWRCYAGLAGALSVVETVLLVVDPGGKVSP